MRARRSRAMAALRKAAQAPGFDDLLAAWNGRSGQMQKVSMLGGGPRIATVGKITFVYTSYIFLTLDTSCLGSGT